MNNKRLTVCIVDDQETSMQYLKKTIEKYFPQLDIIGIYNDSDTALKEMYYHKPQLLFLDIEMPGINGVELAELVNQTLDTYVVFVTGHKEYALEAFRVGATDYIEKPFTKERLLEVLKKVYLLEKQRNTTKASTNQDWLILKKLERTSIMNPKEVCYLFADGAYTNVGFSSGEILRVSKAIGLFRRHLQSIPSFLLVNRSLLINAELLHHIVKLNDNYELEFYNSVKLQVTHRTALKLLNLLEQRSRTKL